MVTKKNSVLLSEANSGLKQYLPAIILACILQLAGTLYCLYFGRIGYMPQDHATVFDGGYRLLCGQFFFRDFTASNAFIPVLLQVPFFYLFGLNWNAEKAPSYANRVVKSFYFPSHAALCVPAKRCLALRILVRPYFVCPTFALTHNYRRFIVIPFTSKNKLIR